MSLSLEDVLSEHSIECTGTVSELISDKASSVKVCGEEM